MAAAERVEALREDLSVLQLAVAEKARLLAEVGEQQRALEPLQLHAREQAADAIALCHKLLREGLDIVRREQIYQNEQIALRMSKLGSNLTAAPPTDPAAAVAVSTVAGEVDGVSLVPPIEEQDSTGEVDDDELVYSPDKTPKVKAMSTVPSGDNVTATVSMNISRRDVDLQGVRDVGNTVAAGSTVSLEGARQDSHLLASASMGSIASDLAISPDKPTTTRAGGRGEGGAGAEILAVLGSPETQPDADQLCASTSASIDDAPAGTRTAAGVWVFDPAQVWSSAYGPGFPSAALMLSPIVSAAAASSATTAPAAGTGAAAARRVKMMKKKRLGEDVPASEYTLQKQTGRRPLGLDNPDVRRQLRALNRALKKEQKKIKQLQLEQKQLEQQQQQQAEEEEEGEEGEEAGEEPSLFNLGPPSPEVAAAPSILGGWEQRENGCQGGQGGQGALGASVEDARLLLVRQTSQEQQQQQQQLSGLTPAPAPPPMPAPSSKVGTSFSMLS